MVTLPLLPAVTLLLIKSPKLLVPVPMPVPVIVTDTPALRDCSIRF